MITCQQRVLLFISLLVDAPSALRGDDRIIINQLKKDYYNFARKKNKNDDKTVIFGSGENCNFSGLISEC
ncbi:hypothetical protein HanRHA438_Chr06g0252761 [Helianthus annuus]|nr:hypothetical protein HanRHA438_Chr06g0252761 [Helianthus annuus]